MERGRFTRKRPRAVVLSRQKGKTSQVPETPAKKESDLREKSGALRVKSLRHRDNNLDGTET